MRAAVVEAETREEVMQETQERMRSMEEMFTRRLMKEVCRYRSRLNPVKAKMIGIYRSSRASGGWTPRLI